MFKDFLKIKGSIHHEGWTVDTHMESMMNSRNDLANQETLRLHRSRLLFSAPMRNKKSMKCGLNFEGLHSS